MMEEEDDRDPWEMEAAAMSLSDGDFEVADCAEIPEEIEAYPEYEDESYDWDAHEEQWQEWFDYLLEDYRLLLALEQSCHEGMALPWDMRGVRLSSAPDDVLAKLHGFWDNCPRFVAARLHVYVYWLVRCERGRRRGNAHWSPKLPLPDMEEERAFFRPRTLIARRQI